MRNNKKTKLLAKAAGVALVVFQMISNTAPADYRGYWMDAVQNHQGQTADYRGYNKPMYAEPAYQDPQYQPAAQYHDNYTPAPVSHPVMAGRASYYANQYQGRPTASGETYNMYDMTAAHRDLPFGTPIRVTNLQNGRSVVVRVNDRGPMKPGRIVDVSFAAAEQLGLILNGSADVQVEVLG